MACVPTTCTPSDAISAVLSPLSKVSETACSIAAAAASSENEYRNIMATDNMVAKGFATPLPAISGALPWIGSYMPRLLLSNEADGNMDWILDGESFYFQSEETGYSTVYQYERSKGKKSCLWPVAKTEVYEVRLAKDRKSMYLEYNPCEIGKTGHHAFGKLNLENLTFTPYAQLQVGFNEVRLSPDEKNLVVRQSFAHKPWELYVKENNPMKRDLRQITHSTSDAFESYRWIDPQVISIPASDGVPIFARIYEPTKETKNGAAIFFVHGAGYLQNAHHYWSNYYREYMFHHLLMEKG